MELPDFVAFDTETTGLEKDARVIEIAGVRFRGNVVLGEYSKLIYPGREIPKEATKINNITNEMVASCPSFERVMIEFSLFMQDAILVAHNTPYDIGRLAYEFSLLGDGVSPMSKLWAFDTLEISKDLVSEAPGFSLLKLADHLGLPTGNLHRALDDSRVVMCLFNYMIKGVEKEDLRKYCRRFIFEQ